MGIFAQKARPNLQGPSSGAATRWERTGQSREVKTILARGRTSESVALPPIVQAVVSSPGEPLDAAARAFLEPRFAHDFGHVRVHADTLAAESARALNARAYTVGKHVVLGQSSQAPRSRERLGLMAHELTHVIQQGSVPAAIQRQVAEPAPAPRRSRIADARAEAARGLDQAAARVREAIAAHGRGDPIPDDVQRALGRFFPAEGGDFLPLLLRRIELVRGIIEAVPVRVETRRRDVAVDPDPCAPEINLLLDSRLGPAWTCAPDGNPRYIAVFREFLRAPDLQATRLVHESFHFYFPSFIRHAERGREHPRADAFAYQGFVGALGGLPVGAAIDRRFPSPGSP